MKYAFAGNRKISCNILKFIIEKGYKPEALFITDDQDSNDSDELVKISGLSEDLIFRGKNVIKDQKIIDLLKTLDLDYIIGIHYPYIIPTKLLNLPKIGFLNLHPAYLPFNKGWNTPTWAIVDKTVYGATLHFMSEKLDEGDIIHQKKIDVYSYDTANTLYNRVLRTEEEVFYEAFDSLINLRPKRKKQIEKGTSYKKSDLKKIQEFSLDDNIKVEEFLNKLRALTTNNQEEMAYYFDNNKKIGVRVEFFELD